MRPANSLTLRSLLRCGWTLTVKCNPKDNSISGPTMVGLGLFPTLMQTRQLILIGVSI
jgi:hypothetical protein